MIKNLKLISQNFALKVNKKTKKCNTINYTIEFYQNLIKLQQENILKLYRNKNFNFNPEFCMSTYKINEILKDTNLDLLIADKVTKNISTSGIKSDGTFYNLFTTFYDNLKNNPDHPLTKELLKTLENKSFLFSHYDKIKLEKIFKSDKKKTENDLTPEEKANRLLEDDYEYENNLEKYKLNLEDDNQIEEMPEDKNPHEENGKKFITNFAKVSLMDDNVKIYLDSGKKKITIKSKHFNSKIKIMGLDDNNIESTTLAFKYVDKHTPNVLLLQKRPIHIQNNFLDYNSDNSNSEKNCYTSILEREDIMYYCKNILSNLPQFKINQVERIVYQEVDTFKTMSWAQSLILKSNYALSVNPQIKIILTDIPIFREIENIFKNVLNKINPKDFFYFMKLNFLFEKYNWLIENCNDRCPNCDKNSKFDQAHLTLENLIEDFLITYQGIEYVKIKNISDKIIKSIKLNDFKGNNIVTFVDEKLFYLVVERLVRDINNICDGKDIDTIEKIFTEKKDNYRDEFKIEMGDFEKLINEHNPNNEMDASKNIKNIDSTINKNNEIFNKLALCFNAFENKKLFENSKQYLPELEFLKDEIKTPIDNLYKLYNDKLNFKDEINLWSKRKYDYKCFPNDFLINKYLEDDDKKIK